MSWQSKEDKSAHGTRVNESKRARLPDPKALLNPLGPPNKGWEASVYVRVHDCVKLRSRSLGKVSLLLTSLLRQKLWECRVAGLRNRRSFLLSFLSIYIYIYKYVNICAYVACSRRSSIEIKAGFLAECCTGLDGRNFVSPVIIDGTNSSLARGKRCAARAA